MKKDDFAGWKLHDEVIIVGKQLSSRIYKPGVGWVPRTEHLGRYQGYIVDPNNKLQLESAKLWATWTEYIDDRNSQIKHEPEIFKYKNEGFTLQLLESAERSSQGGKLSFWNCLITAPDNQEFIIGIAADLLLSLLKNNICDNGVIQNKIRFGRLNGSVGALSDNMDEYKQAVADMETRRAVNTQKKTKKYRLGYTYSSLTLDNVYLGSCYQHYEIIEPVRWTTDPIVIKKLDKPIKRNLFPTFDKTKLNMSDYFDNGTVCDNPARIEGDCVVKIDSTMEEYLEQSKDKMVECFNREDKFHLYPYRILPFICSTSKSDFELSDVFRKLVSVSNENYYKDRNFFAYGYGNLINIE